MEFNDLIKIVDGFRDSRIIHSAVELGIFESLTEEPLDSNMIANSCNCDESNTELLLNALVSISLLNKSESLFSNSKTATEYLVRSSNQYMGDIIRFTGRSWDSWGKLTDSVKSGMPQEPPYTEKQYEEEWESFIRGMHNFALSRSDAKITANVVDLSGKSILLDVACGPGTYSYELCLRYPNLKALLFDLPETIKVAKKISSEYKLEGRLEFVEGDYKNDDFPANVDCALLFNIIHQEDGKENQSLINKIFQRLSENGILVIKDHILNENKTLPEDGSLFSVQMMLTTGGRCYNEIEVYDWMSSAGFSEIKTVGPISPMTSAFIIGTK